MPKFQDKITHTANVAKWKIDQQIRINSSQTKERQIITQIDNIRIQLADAAYKLFRLGELSNDELKQICLNIQQQEGELQNQKSETEKIKLETPPSFPFFTNEHGQEELLDAPSLSGLICPKCKQNVPVRFCPKCGVEGVPVEQ